MSQYAALGLPLIHAGKVRELYAYPAAGDPILMVATDNISAFDFVLSNAIPDKGIILNHISLWWFQQLGDVVANHVLSTDVPDLVAGRGVLVEQLDMVPVECVARGYLTGSGWQEYQANGTVCGVALPAGLHDGAKLPEPIFTPATKAPLGEHDENVDFETMCATTGVELGTQLRDLTLQLYTRAEAIAAEAGIILADTKFEFGRNRDGVVVLADEALTPDSSRFWDAEAYQDGQLLSFDKQYVRNWLLHESGWQRAAGGPPPALPAHIVDATRLRYLEAFERLTGKPCAQVAGASSDRLPAMARVVVEVMPKPEILDPQGKAVSGALERLGYQGLSVRQGKRFEIDVDGELTAQRLDQIRDAAEKLLANTVIESFDVRVEPAAGA